MLLADRGMRVNNFSTVVRYIKVERAGAKPTRAVDPIWQPQLPRGHVVRQVGTNFHRISEAQTLGNSLSVALSAGYSSVRTAGGASDRR